MNSPSNDTSTKDWTQEAEVYPDGQVSKYYPSDDTEFAALSIKHQNNEAATKALQAGEMELDEYKGIHAANNMEQDEWIRFQKRQEWNKAQDAPVEAAAPPGTSYDGSYASAKEFWLNSDPDMKRQYERATRTNGVDKGKYPERVDGFWRTLDMTYQQFAGVANLGEVNMASRVRRMSPRVSEVSTEILTQDVPEEFHTLLLREQDTYGDDAALYKKSMLQEDIRNNSMLEKLPWYTQLGYGVLAAVGDPITYLAGGAVGVGRAGVASVGMKLAPNGIKAASKMAPKTATVMAEWTAMSAAESALVNGTRLAGGDNTYNLAAFRNDVIAEGLLGGAISTALIRGMDFTTHQRATHQAKVDDARATVERMQQEITGDKSTFPNSLFITAPEYRIDAPTPMFKPDYDAKWVTPSKVSDWVHLDERAMLSRSDQYALALYRKERGEGTAALPTADLTQAGIVQKYAIADTTSNPRMTRDAMTQHWIEDGVKPTGPEFDLGVAVKEGFDNWVPHSNEAKLIRASALDSMSQLNAASTMLMKMRNSLSEHVNPMARSVNKSVVDAHTQLQYDMADLARGWQFKQDIRVDEMADVVDAIDALTDRAQTIARDLEEAPDARPNPETGDPFHERNDIDSTALIHELERAVHDAPSALKDMQIARVKVKLERSSKVSDNIRRIVHGNIMDTTVQDFQNITGLNRIQFAKARTAIMNSRIGRDPSFRESEFGMLVDTVTDLQRMDDVMLDTMGLSRKDLDALALDVTELAIFHSDKIPKSLERNLSRLDFKNDVTTVHNVIYALQTGTPTETKRMLISYVESLRKQGIMPITSAEGDVKLISLEEMYAEFKPAATSKRGGHNDESLYDAEDGYGWDADEVVEVEHSQIQDILTLNEHIRDSGDEEAIHWMERLNSVVLNEVTQREMYGGSAAAPVEKFQAVKNSGADILAILRAEGITKDMPEWKVRFRELRNQNHTVFQRGSAVTQADLQSIGNLSESTRLGDILPRGFKMSTEAVHSEGVSPKRLREYSQNIRAQLQKSGVYDRHWQKKTLAKNQVRRIIKMQDRLLTQGHHPVAKAIEEGDLVSLGDIIIASDRIRKKRETAKAVLTQRKHMRDAAADAQKELNAEVRAARGPRDIDALIARQVEVEDQLRTLVDATGDDLDIVTKLQAELSDLIKFRERMTPPAMGRIENLDERLAEVSKALPEWAQMSAKDKAEVVTDLQKESSDKLNAALDKYAEAELVIDQLSTAPRDWSASLGAAFGRLGGLTQDFATTFQRSDSLAMKYIGFRLTEAGKGNGGSVRRKHTGGIIKELEYTKSIAKVIPSYTEAIDAFAVSRGHGEVGKLWQKTQSGEHSPLVDEFNRMFFTYQNDLRMGRTPKEHPIMAKFAKEWDEYMDHNHRTLVDANAAGFTAERKIKHYVPQVWKTETVRAAYNENPEAIIALFEKGYRAAGNEEPGRQARRQMEHILGIKEGTDQFMPDIDSRAKHQMKIDQSVTLDGKSILDYLDIEVAGVATKYSNRVGGWVGIAKSTDGVLSNGLDVSTMRATIAAETKGDTKALRDFDDLIDMMMGRPPRGGIPAWMRSIKDLTVLTRMGGLGTAQAIETGTVLTRALLENSSDPRFLKKLLKGIGDDEVATELLEITKLTGYSREYEWLNRQSVYLDQREFGKIGKAQELGNAIAELVTGGSLKAPASRLLGKASGYNMVRRYQSMIMQRSFGMTVARHFKHGTSKMSPRRMADLGLTDSAGVNPVLSEAINTHVVFDADGYPSQYNFDKWSKEALDTFQYSLQRAESQDLIRAGVGEMPRWMNHPLMQIAAQFRFVPIVSQNKALARAAAFGDREAVTGLALNTMTAGVVRAAKIATLAAGAAAIKGSTWEDEFNTKWDNAGAGALTGGAVDKYITTVGIFPEINSLGVSGASTWQNISEAQNAQEGSMAAADFVMGQIPALGLLRDGYKSGEAAAERDPDALVRHVQGVTMLGNLGFMEMMFLELEELTKGD